MLEPLDIKGDAGTASGGVKQLGWVVIHRRPLYEVQPSRSRRCTAFLKLFFVLQVELSPCAPLGPTICPIPQFFWRVPGVARPVGSPPPSVVDQREPSPLMDQKLCQDSLRHRGPRPDLGPGCPRSSQPISSSWKNKPAATMQSRARSCGGIGTPLLGGCHVGHLEHRGLKDKRRTQGWQAQPEDNNRTREGQHKGRTHSSGARPASVACSLCPKREPQQQTAWGKSKRPNLLPFFSAVLRRVEQVDRVRLENFLLFPRGQRQILEN